METKFTDSAPADASAVGWDDITGSVLSAKLYSVAGKVDYNFSDNSITMEPGGDETWATPGDIITFNIQKLHRIPVDGEFRLHMHYEQTSTNVIQTAIRYRLQKNGEAKTTSWTTVTANTTDNNVFAYTSGTLNQIMTLCVVDLSSSYLSSTVQFQVVRYDDTADDIAVTFIDAHYPTDQPLGSRQEFVK